MYPGFVAHSMDDKVPLGWGSQNGIDCVSISAPNKGDENAIGTSNRGAKLSLIHKLMVELLVHDSIPEDLVRACGWRIKEGSLVSSWGGRNFGIADTEHILCKVWLVVIHSNACRNVSDSPKLSASHCYPLLNRQTWEDHLDPVMEEVWTSFLRLASSSHFDKFKFPSLLLFPLEKQTIGEKINNN